LTVRHPWLTASLLIQNDRTTAQFTLRQSLRSFLGFVLRASAQAKTHFALSRLLLSQNPRQAFGTQNVANWKR
jgi:hypothetical protein